MIPVEQVSIPLLQPRHGVYHVFQPVHGLLVGDKSQLGGADNGRQGVADIGRRSLVVCLHLAVQLVVVRHQPIVLLVHQAVEEVPCILSQLAYLVSLFLGEGLLVLGEFLAQPEHQEGSSTPCHHAEEGGNKVNG